MHGSSVEVTELVSPVELREAAELFASVWGTATEEAPISRDVLRALAHTGNYVAGARVGSTLVGASAGFLVGGTGPQKLHSHITGLAPEAQHQGIGFALKCHQRSWALARGLAAITWTFDPLVRRNGYFNLTRLGAEAAGYHVNFYGDMTDSVNAADESDRCEVTWDLSGARAEGACAGSPPQPDIEAVRADGATIVLEDCGDGTPRCHPLSGDVRLCWIPPDIVALRGTDRRVARSWRVALRDTLGASIEEGLVATAVSRSGWYVLERRR